MTTEYQREWRRKNHLRVMDYARKWRDENREKYRAYMRKFRSKDPLNTKIQRHEYYISRRSDWAAQGRLRQQSYKRNVVTKLGGFCFCCGETELAFLTVEHLLGDGNIHRARGTHIYRDVIKEGFPKDRYGVLCMNCNFARRFGKKCPHQKAVLEMIA